MAPKARSTDHPNTIKARDEFHREVGLAVTSWSNVDDQLFDICAAVTGTTRTEAAKKYSKAGMLGAKLKLVDKLVRSILPPTKATEPVHPDTAQWGAMVKELWAMTNIRARIAHQPVTETVMPRLKATDEPVPRGVPIPAGDIKYGAWHSIYPGEAERLGRDQKDIKPLRLKDVIAHRDLVSEMERRLSDFRSKTLTPHLQRMRQPKRKEAPPVVLQIGKGPAKVTAFIVTETKPR
jgi:hypothetical protein